jgi:hypothetical protein
VREETDVPDMVSQPRSAEEDVARDTRKTRNLLGVLAACCVGAIMLDWLIGMSGRRAQGEEALGIIVLSSIVLSWLFVILDILALVLVHKRVERRFPERQRTVFTGIVIFFLTLILMMAVVLFLFATCGVMVSTISHL